MKAILITLGFLSASVCIHGQAMEIATSSCAGGVLRTGSFHLEYAIGQSFVSHLSEGDLDIQEGIFHNFGDILNSTEELEIAILELSVYPNPSTDHIILNEKHVNQSGTVNIINQSGIRMKSTTYQSGEWLDVSDLQSGIYLAEFITETERKLTQFIKH